MLYRILLTFIVSILFFISDHSSLFAQGEYKKYMYDSDVNFYDVCRMAEDYFSTIDRHKKGSGWNEFMRWKNENEAKFFPSGNRKNIDYYQASKVYQQFKSQIQSRIADPAWTELGPDRVNKITQGYNSGIGRIESFAVHPTDANRLYLGSRSGGFWKTLDGGLTWKNTTDFLVASGVNTISIAPDNPNNILINVRNAQNGYTHGIYSSTDGGNTWTQTILNPANKFGGLASNLSVSVIKHHPKIKGLIFIGTSAGLYRTTDNLISVKSVLAGNFTEIEFHPTDPKTIYFINTNPSVANSITISNDEGLSFIQSAPLPGVNGISGFLDVTPAKANNVYFANGAGVYKSNNKGLNFIRVGGMSNNGVGNFAVSDIDTLNMISGYLNLEGSNDGGKTFSEINTWSSTNPDSKYTHADLRAAECIKGVFYIGTDGYFCSTSDFGGSWRRLNAGTGVREFYRLGISQSNKWAHIAGSQDNGTSILTIDGWNEWNGGDGMEAIIYPNNPKYMVGSWQYGSRQITSDGGASRTGSDNPQGGSNHADWIAPMMYDPSDHDLIYHFSDSMFVSDKFGRSGSWTYVSNPGVGTLHQAAIAENNSDIIAVSRNNNLRLSTDHGITWKSINAGLPGSYIEDIAFDPKRDSTIIVCYGTYENNSQKIFITKNLGLTWQNISYNLNNMPLRSVAIDHSANANIYVGAEIGLYVKPMNGNTWRLYNTNLPNTTVRELDIHYGSNTLKAVTWGRGMWEVPLIDRQDFPKIESVTTSTEIVPGIPIPQNKNMIIYASIPIRDSISRSYLLWSVNNKSLNNKIPMHYDSASIWRSESAIPTQQINAAIYYKIIAVGSHLDSSETYTYMYRQGACTPSTTTNTLRACSSAVVYNDTIYNSKTIIKTFKDRYNCDSTIRINVIIEPKANLNILTESDQLRTVETGATSYQWLDCNDNFNPISGQKTNILSIKKSGIYAVEIQKKSCRDTSSCVPLIITDINLEKSNEVILSPNPNDGIFMIQGIESAKYADIIIYNLDGKKLFQQCNITNGLKLYPQLSSGIYSVRVNNGTNTSIHKLHIR